MKKKEIDKTIINYGKKIAEHLDKSLIAHMICPVDRRKPTKKEIAAEKERERKEKIRRAKKITMTVGEYEDALEMSGDYEY